MGTVMVRRKRASIGLGGVFVFLLVAGVAVAGGYIALGGEITIPFSDPPRVLALSRNVAGAPSGKVAIPVSGRPIKAYSKVTRDDLVDVKNSRLAFQYLDPKSLTPDLMIDVKQILGRVLDHDKPAGYAFTTHDFLPEGTRPGLVAGIPAGKRAVRVEISKVNGLFGLNLGDRFDMVATIAVDKDGAAKLQQMGGIYGSQLAIQASLTNYNKQATVRVIVQNGVVVAPVETRQVPITSNSLTQGALVRYKPVQEMVVAVDPHEVAPLTEALAVDAQLTCVPRSGRTDDPADSVTPDLKPRTPFLGPEGTGAPNGSFPPLTVVETIAGPKRELVPTPRSQARSAPKGSE
jgi:Flp pilus assembly protein CpaB